MSLTLYYHPLASYCHKVLIALYETGAAFAPRIVDPGDPASRAAHLARWPLGKIPVLHDADGDRVVPETSIIIEYLDGRDPERPRMLPADSDARLEARLWDRVFDQYVSAPMQTIVADRLRPHGQKDPRGCDDARGTLATAYEVIDRQVASGAWAAGRAFSIADCAAAPALFYATILQPVPARHRHLLGYFDRLMTRPSVARVLAEARPYFAMFPLADDIPARFR